MFGAKAKREKAENFLKTSMRSGELLDKIIEDLKEAVEGEYAWANCATGYYDRRARTVVVTCNGVGIYNCSISTIAGYAEKIKASDRASNFIYSERSFKKAQQKQIEAERAIEQLDGISNFGVRYTSYGYTPLLPYRDKETDLYLDEGNVATIWASVVRDRMLSEFNKWKFGEIESFGNMSDVVAFGYEVPALYWRRWY